MATSLLQAQELIGRLERHGSDFPRCSQEFDEWCTEHIRPWFDDHVYWDSQWLRRWAGEDIDLSAPLPSDLIAAAVEAAPELGRWVGPYQAMTALPSSLAAAEPRARELYASGWRPSVPDGPSRADLIELVDQVGAR